MPTRNSLSLISLGTPTSMAGLRKPCDTNYRRLSQEMRNRDTLSRRMPRRSIEFGFQAQPLAPSTGVYYGRPVETPDRGFRPVWRFGCWIAIVHHRNKFRSSKEFERSAWVRKSIDF